VAKQLVIFVVMMLINRSGHMSTTALVLYAILTMTTRKIDCLEIDND
jgi:hypothetical protein